MTPPSSVGSPEAELRSLLLDEHRPGTLAHAARHLVDCAYAVRDQLSADTWMMIGSISHELLDLEDQPYVRQNLVEAKLSRVMQNLLALSGLIGESMVRDPGWRFLDAGRRIERGIQLAGLVSVTLAERRGLATDSLLLESTLTATESIITYRGATGPRPSSKPSSTSSYWMRRIRGRWHTSSRPWPAT